MLYIIYPYAYHIFFIKLHSYTYPEVIEPGGVTGTRDLVAARQWFVVGDLSAIKRRIANLFSRRAYAWTCHMRQQRLVFNTFII